MTSRGIPKTIGLTDISTHTLTWSVTGLPYSENAGKHISTHTLTWSVTLYLNILKIITNYFNSHAHVERDLIQFPNFWDIKNFNSHAHVERD